MARLNRQGISRAMGQSRCPYACEDRDGNLGPMQWVEGCSSFATCDLCVKSQNPCGSGTIAPTSPTRRFVGATGQPVTWRKQSGSDSSGKILGLTTQQALIAVGVGVAAYFIIKKVK